MMKKTRRIGCKSLASFPELLEDRRLLAYSPTLLKDIAINGDSGVTGFVGVGSTAFFVADDGIHGLELWKTDGTTEGTLLVMDIEPGSNGSKPLDLININGTLFFTAFQHSTDRALWKSDGTYAGTVMVKDIMSPGYLFDNFTNVAGLLFFTGSDGYDVHGPELWRSDGTDSGTVMVKDLWPGSGFARPSHVINSGGRAFFGANDYTRGNELFWSNGTDVGTSLVKDIRPGGYGSFPDRLVNVNGTVFFTANDGLHGEELWKSDGTDAGTTLVKDIQPNGTSFDQSESPTLLTNVDGTLFFTANDGMNGRELWISDGTAEGTTMVKDIEAGHGNSYPKFLISANGKLFFNGNGQLWVSDGTDEGTTRIVSLVGSPQSLVNVDGVVYFVAYSDPTREELWRSDGTELGTSRIIDNFEGTVSNRFGLTNVNGTLFFVANDGSHGMEPRVFVPAKTKPNTPVNLAASNGAFSSYIHITWDEVDNAPCYELWRGSVNDSSVSALIATDLRANAYSDQAVLPNEVYYYWVKAVNENGASAFSASDSGYVTPVFPTPPLTLHASDGATLNSIQVSWDEVPYATSYEVWRNTRDDADTAQRLVANHVTSPYTDTSVSLGQTYWYWVTARNAFGTSLFSAVDSGFARTPAPTNVAATDGTSTSGVTVTWSPVATATQYLVFRGTSADPNVATQLGIVGGTSFVDTTAQGGQTYYYWTKALNSLSTSDFSTHDIGYRQVSLPPSPVGVTASDGVFSDRVRVSWNAVNAPHSSQDSFGVSGSEFIIDFVSIGAQGNSDDTSGNPAAVGSVPYVYRLAKYETSRQMVNLANEVGGLGLTMNDMADIAGGPRPSMPATGISWNEAARFANWLNVSQGFPPAYNFDTQPSDPGYVANQNIKLWTSEDVGYDAANPYRNSLAKYFLPSVDEWYKGAYYDPIAGTYYDYPTGSNTAPIPVAMGVDPNSAVVAQPVLQGPADVTVAGSSTPYGVVGMSGNVWEWEETSLDQSNGEAYFERGARGGSWYNSAQWTSSSARQLLSPEGGDHDYGFRIASKSNLTYDVARSVDGEVDSAVLLASGITDAVYDDFTAVPGIEYYYFVRSKNLAGSSQYSPSDTGYRSIPLPSMPSNLNASDGAFTDHVVVKWNSVANAASYEVWRANSNNSASAIRLGSNVAGTSYTDGSASTGIYYYFVKAVNISGSSDFSVGDPGFLSLSGPGVPSNVAASDGSYNDKVRITWSGGANSNTYEVWRSSVNDLSTAANISGNVAGTLFDDVTASPGQPNYYWVRGRNLLGPGPFSASDNGHRNPQTVLVDSGQSFGVLNTNDALLGDLDGDGDLDIYLANQAQGDHVLLNSGNGTFTDSGQSLGNFDSIYGDLGDIDGDGDLDAVVAAVDKSVVWINDGSGHFTDSGQRLVAEIPIDVELGDLDGDGDLDAFITSAQSNAIWHDTVWLNNGSGVFTDSGQRLPGSDSRSVQLADLEGDGDLDAFVANVLSDLANRVWINDGQAHFTDSGLRLGSSHTQTLAVGDLNGDGKVDLFEANVNDEPNRVYFNNGNGTFTDSGQLLGNDSSTDVALGDADGDGDLDAAVSNYYESGVLYLNDGTGRFSAVQTLSDNTGQKMAWGDLDGDGDPDLVGANFGKSSQVYFNITQRPSVTQMVRNDGDEHYDRLTSLTLTFSEDVLATVSGADLTLFNTRTNTSVNTAGVTTSLTGVPNQIRFNLGSLALDHGLYFVALRGSGISNSYGTPLDGNRDGVAGDDYQTTTRIAQLGDVNLDGSVDASDAGEMFANWGGAGGTWASGDVNLDGIIDAADAGEMFAFWTGDSSPARKRTALLDRIFGEDGDSTN